MERSDIFAQSCLNRFGFMADFLMSDGDGLHFDPDLVMDNNPPRQFPIQRSQVLARDKTTVPEPVYMAAYEVYCHVWSPQEAMIDLEGRGCRGGFCIDEFVALLYAKSFPKEEWHQRFQEACEGMSL